MTRVPFAIWTPATFDPAYPDGKHYPLRQLSEVEYVVNHDAQGYRSYLKQGHRPGGKASWTLTNQTDGVLLQHYELEEPSWTSGGEKQNVEGVATEHENLAGPWGVPSVEALTPEQVATDRRLFEFLQTVCPNLGSPVFPGGFREHGELTNGATTCPSGRIQPLYDSYNEEDDMAMTQQEHDTLMNVQAQMLEVLAHQHGGDAGGNIGVVPIKDSVLGRLGALDKKVAAAIGTGGLTAGAIVALFAERLAG